MLLLIGFTPYGYALTVTVILLLTALLVWGTRREIILLKSRVEFKTRDCVEKYFWKEVIPEINRKHQVEIERYGQRLDSMTRTIDNLRREKEQAWDLIFKLQGQKGGAQ